MLRILRIRIIKAVWLLPILLVCSCATFTVYPDGELTHSSDVQNASITKINEWPEGIHCFEPVFYVLTLGIIPTHCVNTYSVSVNSVDIGVVKVTTMQGWVTLLMIPLPSWQFGYGNEQDVLVTVKSMVELSN